MMPPRMGSGKSSEKEFAQKNGKMLSEKYFSDKKKRYAKERP